jgi:peptide-methionine (S)-S-oxide reductase
LTKGTRDWEREQLIIAKDALAQEMNAQNELSKLEAKLRPLALRQNLTPDVMDFYLKITGNTTDEQLYDYTKHSANYSYQERAVFAGGCFWCMVEPFETKVGILSVLSGYTGGKVENPTYDQVSSGVTGHVEAVEIIFDNRLINYQELVELYWQITDPTDAFGQFQDRGNHYRPIIFVQDHQQRQIAEQSKAELAFNYSQPIVTEVRQAETFWPAENYHQAFYKKQPKRYKAIKRARQQLLFYQTIKRKIH